MSEINMERAKAVYESVCRAFDEMGWNYEKEEDNLVIKSGSKGKDFPIDVIISINPKAEVISAYSPMPYSITEEKRVEAAVAVCIANYGMINGCFDYDVSKGLIMFRMAEKYIGNSVDGELVNYIIGVLISSVDRYNGHFMLLSKGLISLQNFIEMENK